MVGMTEPNAPDPLAAVKARWFTDDQHRAEYWADLASRDVPRLIGEVERVRELLGRLEWADHKTRGEVGVGSTLTIWPCCPVCKAGDNEGGHRPGCELAAELGRADEAEDQALTELARRGGPEADRALAEGRTRPLPEVVAELEEDEASR
jgi:hypothetical protein